MEQLYSLSQASIFTPGCIRIRIEPHCFSCGSFRLADDVRLELESMRQDDAQKIEENKFHVFDLPITMFYCGSEQTRDHVISLLIGYNSSIKGKLGVGFEEEVKEDE